ncbi:MAG: putative membrane protein YfcA [bacterium]
MFVGASGHLNSAFIGREGLRKEGQVASVAACMFCVHVLKTIVFGIVGFVFYDYALLMFLMIVTGFAGTYVGKHMLFKLPEKLFKIIYKTVITLLALRLLVSIF